MPESWLEELDDYRIAKDEFFKSHNDSPLSKEQRKNFKGLKYFPPDPVFKVKGRIERPGKSSRVELANNRGGVEPFLLVGKLHFNLKGRNLSLNAYRREDDDEAELFVPFKDETTGILTGKYGRCLNVEFSRDDEITIDFNYSYSPYCAYNPEYSCPLPPPENSIPLPVEAGEIGL